MVSQPGVRRGEARTQARPVVAIRLVLVVLIFTFFLAVFRRLATTTLKNKHKYLLGRRRGYGGCGGNNKETLGKTLLNQGSEALVTRPSP